MIPDIVPAFIARTRALAATNAIIAGRTAGRVRVRSDKDPTGWVMPTYACVYRIVPGPSRQTNGKAPVYSQPLQVEWYGPTEADAWRLVATWWDDFFPRANDVAQGFIVGSCSVGTIEVMSAPGVQSDPDTSWARYVGTFLIGYGEAL